MDRQCFEVRIKNCEFFILVARHRYIFYICALAIHWLFRSEKTITKQCRRGEVSGKIQQTRHREKCRKEITKGINF